MWVSLYKVNYHFTLLVLCIDHYHRPSDNQITTCYMTEENYLYVLTPYQEMTSILRNLPEKKENDKWSTCTNVTNYLVHVDYATDQVPSLINVKIKFIQQNNCSSHHVKCYPLGKLYDGGGGGMYIEFWREEPLREREKIKKNNPIDEVNTNYWTEWRTFRHFH